jgi:hypothetical protein
MLLKAEVGGLPGGRLADQVAQDGDLASCTSAVSGRSAATARFERAIFSSSRHVPPWIRKVFYLSINIFSLNGELSTCPRGSFLTAKNLPTASFWMVVYLLRRQPVSYRFVLYQISNWDGLFRYKAAMVFVFAVCADNNDRNNCAARPVSGGCALMC